jgi:cytochrome P450
MTKDLAPRTLPCLSTRETIAVLVAAGGPLLAKGIMIRRPWVVALLQATGTERAGVAILQTMRARYGPGPVLMRLPFRSFAVILSPDHVRRVLGETPEPFQSDNIEKHATLAHFEPRGSLISRGRDRAARRAFSDRTLESACPMHQFASRFRQVVVEEIASLSTTIDPSGELSWGAFKDCWFRIVRRCVFGDHATDDTHLTAMLNTLRSSANWSFLGRRRATLRAQFLSRLASELHRPRPGTLAALAPSAADSGAAPENQVAQWLFAFDAAGIATFRALAVLASNDALAMRARGDVGPDLPFLRACLLEAVRVWPTTPAILRETDRDTVWDGAVMPAGTGVLIHVPFLHRDGERLPLADTFAPDVWLNGEAADWPLIPFGGGPGECPARNLVLLLASTTLAALLARHAFELPEGRALDTDSLPATFDQFSLQLKTTPFPQ